MSVATLPRSPSRVYLVRVRVRVRVRVGVRVRVRVRVRARVRVRVRVSSAMLGVPGMMSELPVGAAMVPGKLRSSTEASEARFASQPVVGAPIEEI